MRGSSPSSLTGEKVMTSAFYEILNLIATIAMIGLVYVFAVAMGG